jgi:hypothetical protein
VNLGFHFDVEQRARSFMGWFFNFNGTAGVWRIEVGRRKIKAVRALCRRAAADVYIQ